jgi:excisionase family DNA binding protein
MKVPKILSVAQTAKLLLVSPKTIRQWIDRGVFRATRAKGKGRPYRIAKTELEKIVGPIT